MSQPLDHHAADRTGWVQVARLFSNIVSPPVMFAAVGLALAWYELPFWPGFGWAAVYGLLVSLAPILVVFYLLRTGRIAELHMTNRRERYIPYLSSVAAATLAYVLLVWFDGPALLRCLALFNMIGLTILALITVFWLISIHATAMAAMNVIVGLVFGAPAGIALLPLLVLVCWARLYLKRHNWQQVVAGLVLGSVTVGLLRLIDCF